MNGTGSGRFAGFWLLAMHPVGRLLSFACRSEDGARIVLKEAQPRDHVGSVIGPGMMGDSKIGEDE
jgi:hypothetical protein